MLCRNCGKELSENDKFCIACGTPVEQEETADVFIEAEVPTPVTKGKNKLLIPIVAIVAVVGIVAALLLSGVFANPTAKLLKAAINSWNAWDEAAVLDKEDLEWLEDAQEAYSGELQLWLEDFPDLKMLEGFGLRGSFDYSLAQRQFGMTLAPTYGAADIVHAQLLLKNNELYIGSEELTTDAYYMIHTDRLGQELAALGVDMSGMENIGFNLFESTEGIQEGSEENLETYEDLVTEAKTIWEQIQVEKAGSGEIDVNGTAMKADTYHVVIPQAAVSALMDALEPVVMSHLNNNAMTEMCRSMNVDAETLAMLEMNLRESTAMYQETFNKVREALEEMGDLELDVFVSDNYLVAVEFAVTYEDVTVDFRVALGGGENYVDNISLSAKDENGEGFLIVSQGDHSAKSGTFTDKTSITLTEDDSEVFGWDLRYAPEAQSDNLSWVINAEEVAIEMNGQLTLGEKEFTLRLEELKLEEAGYVLGAFGFEYRMGQYNPQQVDTTNHKVLAEMTTADMTAAANALMTNAMTWLGWVQQNFPELMSMLMF